MIGPWKSGGLESYYHWLCDHGWTDLLGFPSNHSVLSQEFSEGTEAGLVSEVCLCEEQELAQEIPNAEVPPNPTMKGSWTSHLSFPMRCAPPSFCFPLYMRKVTIAQIRKKVKVEMFIHLACGLPRFDP